MDLLVHEKMPDTPEKNLGKLWSIIRSQYEVLNIESRYSSMKMSMFKGAKGTKLKGTAAEIRHIGRPLLKAWTLYMTKGERIDDLVELALRQGSNMETILDASADKFAVPGSVCFVMLVAVCM